MPKVSIVLPTFNGKRYLTESITSILDQEYTDWELIIVDDCSTDGTSNIVDKYSILDNRIHVIHNDVNIKLPGSLNIGFSTAEGQYLTWTSDDNLFEKDALKTMVNYLDLHEDVYMVRGDMHYIDENGNIIGQSSGYSYEKMYINNCVGACFMYRREVYDAIGDYDVKTFGVEDYDYWLRVLDYFGKIISIEKILYRYRRHCESLTVSRKELIRDQLTKLRIAYSDKIFDVLQKNPKGLYRLYFEMRKSKYMTREMTERFTTMFPALRGVIPLVGNGPYIIFGTGKYGDEAAARLGCLVSFFADSDSHKVGKIKQGIKILAFSEAIKLKENYRFLIAADGFKSYKMMEQLQVAGVKEYSLFDR